jgi:hypothetical protein
VLGPASRRLGWAWRSGALEMARAASVAPRVVKQELEKLASRGGSCSLLEPHAQGGEGGGCPHAEGGDLVPQVGERGTHPLGGGVDALEARAEGVEAEGRGPVGRVAGSGLGTDVDEGVLHAHSDVVVPDAMGSREEVGCGNLAEHGGELQPGAWSEAASSANQPAA